MKRPLYRIKRGTLANYKAFNQKHDGELYYLEDTQELAHIGGIYQKNINGGNFYDKTLELYSKCIDGGEF